jgi:hypothetical protein
MSEYGISATLDTGFNDAVEQARAALAQHGFAVLVCGRDLRLFAGGRILRSNEGCSLTRASCSRCRWPSRWSG